MLNYEVEWKSLRFFALSYCNCENVFYTYFPDATSHISISLIRIILQTTIHLAVQMKLVTFNCHFS